MPKYYLSDPIPHKKFSSVKSSKLRFFLKKVDSFDATLFSISTTGHYDLGPRNKNNRMKEAPGIYNADTLSNLYRMSSGNRGALAT
jgi:hypothetical protein